jgi:hypothetical protein
MESYSPEARLKKRIQHALNAQRPKFDLFVLLDEVYHVKGKDQQGTAQIHAPDSWSHVETVAPRMVARRPTVIYKPREDSNESGADANQALFNYWWDKDNAFTKTVATVKGGLRHGTKLVRWYWKTEKGRVRSYIYGEDGRPVLEAQVVRGEDGSIQGITPLAYLPEEALTNSKFAEQSEEVVTHDDPCMELISSYDFFIDPEATSIQEAAWIIFRFRKGIQELKSYGKYQNLDEVEAAIKELDEESSHAAQSRKYADLGTLEADDTIDRITCWEMWEKGPNGIQKCTVSHGLLIEPVQDNPYWHGRYPFSRYLDSIVDGEFWGKGELEPVLTMQWTLDTLMSMDLDNRTLALDPKWKVSGDVDEAEIFEGNVIHVDEKMGRDANPVEVPDFTGSSQAGIAGVRETMQKALGIYDYAKGGTEGPSDTATGISAVIEAANARFNLKIQHLEEFIKEMGFFVMSLYQQHLTDEKLIRVMGEDGVEEVVRLSPADIAGMYDIDVESGSSKPANRDAEREAALQVYGLVSQAIPDPQFQTEALKFVLSKFDGVEKITDALDGAMQRVQEQQAMMMQQEQAMQQQVMDQEGRAQEMQAREAQFAAQEAQLDQEIQRAEQMMQMEQDQQNRETDRADKFALEEMRLSARIPVTSKK